MSMSRPRAHVLSHLQLAQDMQEGLNVLWSVLGSWEPGCGTEALSQFDAALMKKTKDKHDILKQTKVLTVQYYPPLPPPEFV